jgi:hypothetical protein
LAEAVSQGVALDEFEDQVWDAVILSEVEDSKNVGMVEAGDRTRLLVEPVAR